MSLFALSMLCSPVWADDSSGGPLVAFDIPRQRADLALTEFAEQADLTLVFPSDVAREKLANPLIGEYTLEEGVRILLSGTGLNPAFSNRVVLSVAADEQSADGGRDVKASKKASLLAVLGGVFAGEVVAQEATVLGERPVETSIVTGKVTDARTGANLKGAKVTIEETGQWTSANELGEFRLVNVPIGSATITVSFLGYAGQSTVIGVRSDPIAQNFALRGGSELEEIVVIGQRSARALALNQERTSDNFTTVISSDLLGSFNGTTISDALRRAPGVAFVPNEATGEGANVIIRGLEPDFNQITLNGVRLAEGSGTGRSADLSGILTESIESVTIYKTLLPSQDSNGAGALIEIETKSPLDRARRFVRLGVEYGEQGGDFGDNALLSGTLSGKFLDDESLGASVSVQYRDRKIQQLNYNLSFSQPNGQFVPLDEFGEPPTDPRTPFPFVDGVDLLYPNGSLAFNSVLQDENLSTTGTLEKEIGDHTNLRFDATRTTIRTSSFTNQTASSAFTCTVDGPIPEFNNQIGRVRVSEDCFVFAPGVSAPVQRSAAFNPETKSETTVLSFRGDTSVKNWDIDYRLGYSKGSNETPLSTSISTFDTRVNIFNPLDLSLLADDVRTNTFQDRLVSIFRPVAPGGDNSFVTPGFNQAGFDFWNDPTNVLFGSGFAFLDTSGENERFSGRLSTRRSFQHENWKYVAMGISYEKADFVSINNLTTQRFTFPGATLSDFNIGFAPSLLTQVGAPGDLFSLSQFDIENFWSSTDQFVNNGQLILSESTSDLELRRTATTERDTAAYIETKFEFGKLELIGGLRFTQIDVSSEYPTFPGYTDANGMPDFTYALQFSQAVQDEASQSSWLPRILANYRLNENMIFRAGYYTTVSRPQVRNLTAFGFVDLNDQPIYGPAGNQPRLLISQGNPDLKPAFTHSFDASWEMYFEDIGTIKLSGFYKTIENPLQASSTVASLEDFGPELVLPDTPEYNRVDDTYFIELSRPVNGENSNDSWGIETSIERQFTFLPGFWKGFGFYGNITYADSSSERVFLVREQGVQTEVTIDGVPFDGASEISGTARLTYSGHGLDANITYTMQDRRLSNYERFGLHAYDEAIDTLDFGAIYTTEVGRTLLRLSFEGRDLLRGKDEAFLETSIGGANGVPKYFTGGRFFGGRSFVVGAAVTF